MNKKVETLFFLLTIVTLIISVILTIGINHSTQKELNKFEYIVDNSNIESSIAIMIKDLETNEYMKTNMIPMGRYELNLEKTNCAGRGILKEYNPETGTIKFETEAADECYLYFDQLPEITGAFDEILANYTGQGMTVGNGVIYLHDSTLENSANDGSYRYAGADPDNYLCFEGDTCDDDHKYRIIGIFGENLKVIKMTSLGNKVWNSSGANTWDGSTMDTYLNGEWLTSFGHQDLIEDYDWHVGGHKSYSVTPKVMYDAEIASTLVVNRKVGLMYASDFGYGALNNYWTTNLYSYDGSAHTTDWLKLGSTEWTISRDSSVSNYAFIVHSTGYVYYTGVIYTDASRPSFYLKSSVEIKSGSGSKTDPWIMG